MKTISPPIPKLPLATAFIPTMGHEDISDLNQLGRSLVMRQGGERTDVVANTYDPSTCEVQARS